MIGNDDPTHAHFDYYEPKPPIIQAVQLTRENFLDLGRLMNAQVIQVDFKEGFVTFDSPNLGALQVPWYDYVVYRYENDVRLYSVMNQQEFNHEYQINVEAISLYVLLQEDRERTLAKREILDERRRMIANAITAMEDFDRDRIPSHWRPLIKLLVRELEKTL